MCDEQMQQALSTLHKMHPDARTVLVSEMMCDVVYTIFFGGYRFTHCKLLSTHTICPQTSPLADISKEIKHRLGYIPELAKTEAALRHLIDLLTSNNLAFHQEPCNDLVYEMRDSVSFAAIETESILGRKFRLFKNASRAHYSTMRRLVSSQHSTYKRTLATFLAEIIAPTAEKCADWLCVESSRTLVHRDKCVALLHSKVAAFEKATRL